MFKFSRYPAFKTLHKFAFGYCYIKREKRINDHADIFIVLFGYGLIFDYQRGIVLIKPYR